MIFRCPNIQAHYNEAVIYLNFGTPKNNEFLENLLFLGVPILKHIRVYPAAKEMQNLVTSKLIENKIC